MELNLRSPTAEETRWKTMTFAEKNERLLENQIELLNLFLVRNAISSQQYEKSLSALPTKQHAAEERG